MAGLSLTHVSKWTKDGWTHVTAEEESRNHPGGTVSAESGLYRCDLCRQYVGFTKEGEKARHFRHSNKEKSKNCPERTFALGRKNEIPLYAHELPLRLRVVSMNSFQLEIGFIPIPESLLEIQRSIITISFRNSTYSFNRSIFEYSVKDRIECSAVSYLSVGNLPVGEYYISVSCADDRIKFFWPNEIAGVDQNGSFFDIKTEKRFQQVEISF